MVVKYKDLDFFHRVPLEKIKRDQRKAIKQLLLFDYHYY